MKLRLSRSVTADRGAAVDRGRLPELRFSLLLALLGLVAGAPLFGASDSVRLVLANGETLEGRVVDLGDERLEVNRRLGRSYVLKRDVKRWQIIAREEAPVRSEIVMFRSGNEVEGEVEYNADLGEYVVKLDVGNARYPEFEVLRVVAPSGECSDGTFSPRPGIESRVQLALAKVKSDSEEGRERGRRILMTCGFFALRDLETALLESDPHGVIQQIVAEQKMRVQLPPGVNEIYPDFLRTLTTASDKNRISALRDVFLEKGAEAYPFLGAVVLDERQPAAVRSFAVDVLQRMNQLEVLVNAYENSTGRAQLAVAVALGDAGIYVGIPSLVEALTLDDPAARELAISKLREYTAEDFGFDPQADPQTQRTAVARWQGWWRDHREKVEERLSYRLQPEAEDPRRLRAAELWRQGNQAWERGEVSLAEKLYRQAVDEDPTALAPFVALGILSYQVKKDYSGAAEWFRRGIRRSGEEAERPLQRLCYYHLGRIYLLGLDFELSREAFRKAIEIDPSYADAWRELGAAIYQDALLTKDLSSAERRERFLLAARTYEKGLDRLRSYREDLVLLSRSNLPLGSDLPFSTREHNRTLRKLREHLKEAEADFASRIARIHLALGDHQSALEWGKKAIDSPSPNADDHLFLADLFRSLGLPEEAERELAAARRLDPDHERFRRKN